MNCDDPMLANFIDLLTDILVGSLNDSRDLEDGASSELCASTVSPKGAAVTGKGRAPQSIASQEVV